MFISPSKQSLFEPQDETTISGLDMIMIVTSSARLLFMYCISAKRNFYFT
jgi:hypothetical protein